MYLYCYVYVFLLYVYGFLLSCMCCILFHCVVLRVNMYLQLPPGLNPIAVNKIYTKRYVYRQTQHFNAIQQRAVHFGTSETS